MRKLLLSIAIAVIYPIFMTKLSDKLLGYDNNNSINVERYQNRYIQHNPNSIEEEEKKRRYYILTLIGVLSVVGGYFIKEESISTGISLGGLFILIGHTLLNWYIIDDMAKLSVLGLSLAIMIYAGQSKKLF